MHRWLYFVFDERLILQLEHFVEVACLRKAKLELGVGVVSWLDAQRLHSFKSFEGFLRFVLLGTCLHIEAEVALGVGPLVEERFEARIDVF